MIPAGKLKGAVQFAAGIFLTAFLLQCALQFKQDLWQMPDRQIQLQQESEVLYGVSDAYAKQIVAHTAGSQASCQVLRQQDGSVRAICVYLPKQDLFHEAAQNLNGTRREDVITDAFCGIYGIERGQVVFYGG